MTEVAEHLLRHLRRAKDLADQRYAEPLNIAVLASEAGISKYHFLRAFAATYGLTPAAYITERRIERAQDLLRTSNLTVTDVCMLVGFSSLGSFSTTFRRLVGESPSAYQRRYATSGAPHIPGCYVFMIGLQDRQANSARSEKPVSDESA